MIAYAFRILLLRSTMSSAIILKNRSFMALFPYRLMVIKMDIMIPQ